MEHFIAKLYNKDSSPFSPPLCLQRWNSLQRNCIINVSLFSPRPFACKGGGAGGGVIKLSDTMVKKRTNNIQNLAQTMRNNSTEAERFLWYHLRDKFPEIHFRRQYQIGKYITDFIALKNKIIIECDGGQHTQEKDRERDLFLQSKGYTVLRFWNREIFLNLQTVLTVIYNALQGNPTPNPSTFASKGAGNKRK